MLEHQELPVRKSKKKFNYTVAVVDMTPFPGVMLYITGDYYKAAGAIDKVLKPRNNSDDKASRLVIKHLDADTILCDKNTKGVTISSDDLDNLIVVYMKDPEPGASTVIHELLHAVMIVADRAGVDDKNHETEAYLMSRIIDDIFGEKAKITGGAR